MGTDTAAHRTVTGRNAGGARLRATLVADGGTASASTDDFFRHPRYLRAEGVTHTLVLRGPSGEARTPLVVRDVPGTEFRDAISPCGYPGATRSGCRIDPTGDELAGLGLVSLFLRDRVTDPSIGGGVPQGRVNLYDPDAGRSLSKSFRRDVRRCMDAGYRLGSTHGTAVDDDLLAAFHRVYTQTMRRRSASGRYYFDRSYLRDCLDTGRARLLHATAPDGTVAAADLVVESDGLLHSLLFGTADEHLSRSPGKAVTMAAIDLADELGLPFNVGGGLLPGDGLEQSKKAYCNSVATFVCHHLIGIPAAYAELSRGVAPTDFFPAYRAR